MKLIIDIDKEDFEIMKHNIAVGNPLCPLSQEEMVSKVANGIPLDKIRAEIAEIQLIGYAIVDGKREIASRAVMQVLDKYKGESNEPYKGGQVE